jgi:hypothetical protein
MLVPHKTALGFRRKYDQSGHLRLLAARQATHHEEINGELYGRNARDFGLILANRGALHRD